MKSGIFLAGICIAVTGWSLPTRAQCKIDYSNYTLILNEQFDTYGGNTANLLGPGSLWKATFQCKYSGWGVEYFEPSQVSLIPDGSGGHRLRLTAERLPTPVDDTDPDYPGLSGCRSSEYTSKFGKKITFKSGILTLKESVDMPPWAATVLDNTGSCPPGSSGDRGWSYGMFEIRCKKPSGGSDGLDPDRWDTWPAFWLIGHGELDIIDDVPESPGPSDPGKFYSSGKVDWTRYPESNPVDWVSIGPCPSCPEYNSRSYYAPGALVRYNPSGITGYRALRPVNPTSAGVRVTSQKKNFSNDFTTYTAVWTPDKITVFVEGREMYTLNGDMAKLDNGCPLNMLVDLQMHPSAIDPDVPFGRIYQMDVDYIKIYKPNQGDYNLSYKSASESIHHDIFADLATAPVNVSSKPGSIAPNTADPNEVFYRGTDDYIYVANRISGNWSIKKLEFNDGPAVKATGDIRYVPGHDVLIYAGENNRINMFGRSTVEPCGFHHWYITSNWSCWWCVTDDYISNNPGTLQVTSDGSIYFAGTDNHLHRYRYSSSAGTWVQHNFGIPFKPAAGVKGDIIVDEATDAMYYKGIDNKIYSYWSSGTAYYQAEIPPGGTPSAFEANAAPNSLAWAPSLNRIMYMGSDNKIHYYELISSVWTHNVIPYTYPAFTFEGYPNGELVRGNIAWDDYNKRLHYIGYDGRMQLFGYSAPGSWWHWHTDDYGNTDAYKSFNSSASGSSRSSVILGNDGPNKSIFYTQADNHLAYFKHEPCEYNVTTSEHTKQLNKRAPAASQNVVLSPDDISVYPNPTTGMVQIKAVTKLNIRIVDIAGRLQLEAPETNDVDISSLENGLYLMHISDDKGRPVKTEKITKLR